MIRKAFFLLTALCMSLTAAEEDIAKVSESFGHLIGKNLETMGLELDLNLVIKGLQDSSKGKESPLSESECIEALTAAQEKAFQKQSTENLAKAEAFLKNNEKNNDVVVVDDKLQYKVEKKGGGETVKSGDSPVIHYTGKFMDGSVFGQSQKDEKINLEETIPGFQKGIAGMKEGEKRTLYIHPEYGYGTQGYLPPNSLLTFEIEIVKANSPEKTE